jgi:hypothetical protein
MADVSPTALAGAAGSGIKKAAEPRDATKNWVKRPPAELIDRNWFSRHPARRFRCRQTDRVIWLIRRVPQHRAADVLLRVQGVDRPYPESGEESIAEAWFAAAFPDWPPALARRAAQSELAQRRREDGRVWAIRRAPAPTPARSQPKPQYPVSTPALPDDPLDDLWRDSNA